MNKVYLILGGNLGNRAANISAAIQSLQKSGIRILKTSALYETEPWQMSADTSFLNQAVEAETQLEARHVLDVCLSIEKQAGRERTAGGYSSRAIDIDILFFNNEVITEPGLVVPHPRLQLRRFVLVPMHELNSGFLHPVLGKTIVQLLDECADNAEVKVYSDSGILK